MLNKLIFKLAANPKHLFLLDSMGGLASAVVPLLILWKFDSHFGLPSQLLVAMALTGFTFGSYSLLCALKIKSREHLFLKILVIANSTYLISLMVYTASCFSDLSPLGLAYLIIDHVVLSSVIALEIAVLRAISNSWIPSKRS